jgi:hypothetical protein
MAASFALTVAASRRTSTTFDEIIMMAGGARGFETGHFDLAPEHPPLTQYLYGLPVYLSGISYPRGHSHSPIATCTRASSSGNLATIRSGARSWAGCRPRWLHHSWCC